MRNFLLDSFKRITATGRFKRLWIPVAAALVGVVLIIFLPKQAHMEALDDSTPSPVMASTLEPTPKPKLSPSPEPTPAPTPELTPEPTQTPDPNRWKANPLTGERQNAAGEPWDETLSRNRPWAVSIGNTADAMPLWGIGAADIICEHVVETVATRILAIYQDISEVGRIGGIRSLRSSNMEIAAGFDAIFAHWIGRTYDNAVASGKPVTAFGTIDAAKLGSRDPSKNQPNDAIVSSGKRLMSGLPETFRTEHEDSFEQGFSFVDDGTPPGGLPAERVTVTFSGRTGKKTEFIYDSDAGCYYVRQYGIDLVDGNDNKRLSFANVLILRTEMEFDYNPSKHTYIETTGRDAGFYVNGGKYVGIMWSREDMSSPYRCYLADGTPLRLGVGRTYFCIVCDGSTCGDRCCDGQVPVFE